MADTLDPSLAMHAAEKIAVERALEASGWNISRAARQLKLSRSTLYRKMRIFAVTRAEQESDGP